MDITTARTEATTAYHALLASIETNGPTHATTTAALAELNRAQKAAVAVGAREHDHAEVTIVDGKTYVPSGITADRAAQIVANAAAWNAKAAR